jgi:flagellar assembly factor FliW
LTENITVPDSPSIPEKSVIHFPEGIPGFETCKRFVILEPDDLAPLLLLHTVEGDALSLPVLPVEVVASNYRLQLQEADRQLLGLPLHPVVGKNVVCLTVLVLPGSNQPATCNMMAPIVINPDRLLAKQVVQLDSEYSSVHPLLMK